MRSRLFHIWFSLRCGVGNDSFIPLLAQYGSPYEIFMADEAEIERMPCDDILKQALCDKSLNESNRILDYCQTNGVGILFWQDENYPESLRALLDPPLLLYYKGKLPDFSRCLCVGVVGTRKMSEYGRTMAYKIGYELAAAGAVVVSGLALGVDSVAAAGAIQAGGCTVAVLGNGIDRVYPTQHKTLANAIARHGVLITEYPPDTPPLKHHFPVRNRLISGLSQGTVVIEADPTSGALITAKTAIAQGRDIYAVPGNVGEDNTSGTNQLIRDGASVVLHARDILENYTFLYGDTLDMMRLQRAEREGRSSVSERALDQLRVCVRTTSGKPHMMGKNAPVSHSVHVSEPQPCMSAEQTKKDGSPSSEPAVPSPTIPRAGDKSEEIWRTLTETQQKIFALVPLDRAVNAEQLTREGYTMSEIMAAMTVLEIKGMVQSLPGGLFARR